MELCEKDNTSSSFYSFLHNTIRELYHRVLQPEQPYWSLICIFKNFKAAWAACVVLKLHHSISKECCLSEEMYRNRRRTRRALGELTLLQGQMPLDLQKNLIDSSFHHAALLHCVTWILLVVLVYPSWRTSSQSQPGITWGDRRYWNSINLQKNSGRFSKKVESSCRVPWKPICKHTREKQWILKARGCSLKVFICPALYVKLNDK